MDKSIQMLENTGDKINCEREQQLQQHVVLYGPDFTTVHSVPTDAIVQMPAPKLNVKRLVECLNFAAAREEAGGVPLLSDDEWLARACCAQGGCKFVHISKPLSSFPGRAIHVHYIWQSVKAVSYRRVWGGACKDAPSVRLMGPPDCRAEVKRYDEQRQRTVSRLRSQGTDVVKYDNEEDERVSLAMKLDLISSVAPEMRIPATRLLRTAGAAEYLHRQQNELEPQYRLFPCPGYTCHNECRLGEECPDAHVINLDVSQSTPFVRRTLRHVKAASELVGPVLGDSGRVSSSASGGITATSMSTPESTSAAVGFIPFNDPQRITNHPLTVPPTGCYACGSALAHHRPVPPMSINLIHNISHVATAARTTQTERRSSSSPMQFNASSLDEGSSMPNSSAMTSFVSGYKSSRKGGGNTVGSSGDAGGGSQDIADMSLHSLEGHLVVE